MAAVLAIGAIVAWMPWTLDWLQDGNASGHMQSIILGAVLAISCVQMFALGVIADQISSLRAIGIRTLRETREMHYGTLYADARVTSTSESGQVPPRADARVAPATLVTPVAVEPLPPAGATGPLPGTGDPAGRRDVAPQAR
jgi:hypothetical protein